MRFSEFHGVIFMRSVDDNVIGEILSVFCNNLVDSLGSSRKNVPLEQGIAFVQIRLHSP
jgi:hypothetical protein